MKKIKVKIRTESNCLIGSATQSFNIGGVDQCTTLDNKGNPIIQASAFKGSLRAIIKNEDNDMEETEKFYRIFFEELIKRYEKCQQENNFKDNNLKEAIKRIRECSEKIKAEYLFGIEAINMMPRLYFSDLKIIEEANKEDYFIIDSKTSIETDTGEVISNPRIYKAIKPGMEFEGEIILKNFENKEISTEKIIEEIIKKLELFNEGYYRIGNSKTRGYGKISVEAKSEL